MNGFRDDVISILRDNVLLHGEAMGWIIGHPALLKALEDMKLPVTGTNGKGVFLFDYIVITHEETNVLSLMDVLSYLSNLGLLIVEITPVASVFRNEYRSVFGGFTARKLKYGERSYLVFHQGVDYGN